MKKQIYDKWVPTTYKRDYLSNFARHKCGVSMSDRVDEFRVRLESILAHLFIMQTTIPVIIRAI